MEPRVRSMMRVRPMMRAKSVMRVRVQRVWNLIIKQLNGIV